MSAVTSPATGDFAGRVAIVTGAARGLGRAVAARLHERGASVAINVRDAARAEQVARSIGERARAVPADVAAPDGPASIVRQTLELFGRIDILINNAALPLTTRFERITAAEWRRAIEVNLTAPFLLIQAVLPAMKAQGYGRIVNISSTAGRMVSTLGGAHYTTSKTGLLGLTRAAAKELGRYGITVNAVCPGMIDTELTRESASPEVLEGLAKGFPVPRLGTASGGRRSDLFRRVRERRLHHRRVAGHQRWRSHDVGARAPASQRSEMRRAHACSSALVWVWPPAWRSPRRTMPTLLERRRRGRADRHALGQRDSDDCDSARRLARDHGRGIGVERRHGRQDRPPHDRSVLGDAHRRDDARAAARHRGVLMDVARRDRPAGVAAGAAEAASSLATGATAVRLFGSWLTSLVPTNPIAAAANGAMLPLVLFTLLLALAIAHAPADGRDALLRFFRGLGDAMQVLVRWVIWCAPVGVFALMLPLGAHGGAGFAGAVGFYIAAYSLASILFVLLLYPAMALFARRPMREFARRRFLAQLIAFSSSSSIASLPALIRGADERLKLSKDVTGFVLPLAISTFKFAAPVSWTFGALFVAWFYQVDLGPSAYFTIAFTAIFLAFAAPGVPARRLSDAGADVPGHWPAG